MYRKWRTDRLRGRTSWKISTSTIKHTHTLSQLRLWGQCGSLLTVYRQVGYFHCAANCVINSLRTESIDRSPGVTVCKHVCLRSFFLFCLTSLHHWFLGCSGSADDCPSCVPPISSPQSAQSAVL